MKNYLQEKTAFKKRKRFKTKTTSRIIKTQTTSRIFKTKEK